MPETTTSKDMTPDVDFDAIVVGAGFAGMYMLHRLRGLGARTRVFEAGSGVGGTWFWNRYPGARCDVQSLEYSYSFSPELRQEWRWTERYPSQPELLRYAEHVADRFDLRRDIQFDTRVTQALFDEAGRRWMITADSGEVVSARFLITAVGCLSATNVPDLPGLESFQGEWHHTSRWPQDGVELTGRRVAVVGTGSSGIQCIPVIARQAQSTVVFQRTPNFSIPAFNGPLDRGLERWFAENHETAQSQARGSATGFVDPFNDRSALEATPEERLKEYQARWDNGGVAFLGSFADLMISEEANRTAADFVRDKIREIVTDPGVAELLTPKDHPIGAKRICVDTDYYATYNLPGVTLVDVRANPIQEITEKGIRTAEAEYECDTIVFATGFDAMTGPLFALGIRGKDGLTLREKWAKGPRSYLGLMSAGFPNLFTITGPGSPSVLSSMMVSIEQHVDWIADCVARMRRDDLTFIDADAAAESGWVDHVNEIAGYTLYGQADSWYTGANVPGKPRVFTPYAGGVGNYRLVCDQVAAGDYEGFTLSR